MAKPPRFVPRDTSRRRMSVYLAVGAFIAVDILLIALALSSHRVGAEAGAPQAAPSITAPASTSTSTASPAPAAEAEAEAVLPLPPTRLLGAVDENTAWRAVTGDCPATAASPELTTDGGDTWKTTDATGPTEVTALQRLIVTSEGVVEMVGLTEADCAPAFVKTFVGGDNYSSYPDKVAETWFIDPADRANVHTPSGSVKSPCEAVVTVAARDDESASVLCADGRLFYTTDATTWFPFSALPGVVSLTATNFGFMAATVGRSECLGVQILSSTTSPDWVAGGCFETATAPSDLAGRVALSSSAGAVWLWAGDEFVRSVAGGSDWK